MTLRTYLLVSGIVFCLIAVAHLIRAILWTPVVVGTVEVTMWPSWLAIIFTGYLAFSAFRLVSGSE